MQREDLFLKKLESFLLFLRGVLLKDDIKIIELKKVVEDWNYSPDLIRFILNENPNQEEYNSLDSVDEIILTQILKHQIKCVEQSSRSVMAIRKLHYIGEKYLENSTSIDLGLLKKLKSY